MKHDWTTSEAWGKTSAALLGSTALYLAFCVVCVTALPVGPQGGMALGIVAGFPVWVGGVCYAVLARSVARAWGVLIGAAGLLAGWAVLAVSFS
jgi:hypothetical protein